MSAGTGRNLPYYSNAAASVTMSDTSKNMLWHARQKHHRSNANLHVTFCLADAQRMLATGKEHDAPESDASGANHQQQPVNTFQTKLQTFNPAQFDTVVDTFGLCSHEDPVAARKVTISC